MFCALDFQQIWHRTNRSKRLAMEVSSHWFQQIDENVHSNRIKIVEQTQSASLFFTQ